MKAFTFRGPDFLFIFIVFIVLQRADCESCEPIQNNAEFYLTGSFHSLHSDYNRTLTLLKVHEDDIYVAGNNALFHLSGDLGTVRSVHLTEGEENTYKILQVSESQNKLITCGSAGTGDCEYRELNDINQTSPLSEDVVSPGDYTTVGIIAPDRYETGESLYVARGLEKNAGKGPVFEIQLQGRRPDRKTDDISSSIADSFVIHYSGKFMYKGFVYFLASQRDVANDAGTDIIPKLSRLCVTDDERTDFSAFTEIKLGCKGEEDNLYSISHSLHLYEDRLFIVFNENEEPENERNPVARSALCVYNMTILEDTFRNAAVACGCHSDGSNNNYLSNANCQDNSGSRFCRNSDIVNDFICRTEGIFKYPEQPKAQNPITEDAILEQADATFSSVTIAQLSADRNHTVALIGTKEGTLLKAHLDEPDCLVYETINIGAPVLGDTTLVDSNENLLVLTEEKVLKMKVVHCSQFSTCEECIRPGSSLGDPYCGWCTLEKRCTRYMECPNNTESSRWLPFDESNCAAITAVSPPSLAVERDSQPINLTIAHLPALSESESYQCRFNGIVSQAEVDAGTLECDSPPESELPKVKTGDDSVIVKLHVYSSETKINFITTDYQFYSCGAIKSCSLCVNNEWECDWCKFEHRCTHNSASCSNDKIIYGSYSLQDKSTAADSCPQIIPQETKLIPTEVSRTLSFQAKNLLPLDGGRVTGYMCQLKALNPPGIEVNYMAEATLKTSDNITFNITCDQQEYTYNMDMQYLNTNLTLKWNSANMVDQHQPVRLYKCSSMRPDCSRCLSPITTPEEYDCVWCMSSNKCIAKEKCMNHHGRDGPCPKPEIISVEPKTAPLGGGTRVTLKGSNLGRKISDIESIKLVDVPCKLLEDTFEVGESITCEAGRTDTEKLGSAFITVDGKDGMLPDSFHYKDPEISNFEPKRGPLSGGTTVTITGVKLDTGSNLVVYIGTVPCDVMSPGDRTAERIYCVTGDAREVEEGEPFVVRVNVTFDGTTSRVSQDDFSFEFDPVVEDVEPLKAIRGGGIVLTVTGKNFDLIQNPKIIAKRNGSIISDMRCKHNENNTAEEMICPSPSILEDSSRERRQADEDVVQDVVIGFKLDGVKSAENWTRDNDVVFEFFEDPTYERFKDDVMNFNQGTDDKIEIMGTNINTASSPSDVRIFVGQQACKIQLFAEKLIYCTPPPNQPEPVFLNGSTAERRLPIVTIKHGENLVFEIGYVKYVSDPTLYIVIGICALLLLIVLIAAIIIYGLRKSKNKEVERLIVELTNVRTNISEELRELFAMLQTAMDKFETNPEGLPVLPLIERSEYVKNMLFLNLNVQPTTEHPMASEVVDAMKKFSELINNKSFLLVFIRTLDKEKNLPMMDRVNIASLITLALLLDKKLDYLTDVMMTLMSEEIEDIVEKGRPRQLFRRNESIVEKLVSNWVAICMYDYLETVGAEKIIQLYGAIQCVIEKGPIDAVSGKSQFSLSDEHMLESHIQFEEVNLQVVANEEDGEIASVTVLNVDSVTQVKNKILDYLNRGRPYSSRPIASDMDLEWRQGVSGQLVLRDEGIDSEVKDGWKKINTLSDYRVENDCRVALIKKQAHPNAQLADRSDIVARGADMSEINESSFLQRCFCTCCVGTKGNQEALNMAEKVPLHRSPTLVEATVEEGVSLWHLIKETEGLDDIQHKSKSKRRLQKKGIKEVLLPLLPATRNALQKYVDGAFGVMLSADQNQVPKCIKYLFDFFDRQATKYSVDAPEVVNAWKNNVLPLRFWTTIMANPTYIFDVRRSRYVEACLRVLVQVLRDACSKSDFKLNKDSSPSRLLYASLLPTYTAQVERYYKHIQDLPRLNPDDTKEEFARMCKPFEHIFNRENTMFQLYQFAKRFNESLNAALEDDDDCQNANLVYRMEQVGITLNE